MAAMIASCTDQTSTDAHDQYAFSLLKRFRSKKKRSPAFEPGLRERSISSRLSHRSNTTSSFRSSILEFQEPSNDKHIEDEFNELYEAIVAHVHEFYSREELDKGASQTAIEHATAGLGIPWPQILALLGEKKKRLGGLVLCIAWTILSRSLLLKLGMSNTPGSTFLPPEIVECFQSFSVPSAEDHLSVNLGLLSRWKQISAALMHVVYTHDTFSAFDARTVNIERALNDLEPLLQTYASSSKADHEATSQRIKGLREVLRKGARLAFTLFGARDYFQFDWNGPLDQHDQVERGRLNMGGSRERKDFGPMPVPGELVIWPGLLRVMDGEGKRLEEKEQGNVLGKKIFLADFE